MDLDGDQDVIAASAERDRVLWYANSDSSPGTFAAAAIVTTNTNSVQSVFVADVNADGNPDVLSASYNDDKIAWYENLTTHPGLPHGWVQPVIASDAPFEAAYRALGASSVYAEDLDGDGDGDVLSASSGDNIIAWYEQTLDEDDGTTIVFVRRVISNTALLATFVAAADIDSDGYMDVLSAATGNDQIAWYENDLDTNAGADVTFTKHAVDSAGANPGSVVARDVNLDDRVDLFAGFRFKVSWYKQIGELCEDFDVNGDQNIDGIELAWLGRAFGQSSDDPQWWSPIDYNQDGFVDGDDLAILADPGVWGETVTSCSFTCR